MLLGRMGTKPSLRAPVLLSVQGATSWVSSLVSYSILLVSNAFMR